MPPAVIKQIEHRLGFDKPLYTQYGDYLWDIVRGNFGTTITDNRPLIAASSRQNGAATLELTFFAMLVAIVVGVLVGLVAGRFRDTPARRRRAAVRDRHLRDAASSSSA